MTSKTVLVVDDDQAILDMVKEALEDEGYRVLTAIDGEALDLAARHQPAVILLDVRMPEMDGIAVTMHLRANPQTAAIPIVLSSAQDRLSALPADLPVDDRLPKPYNLTDLYDKIEYWAQSSKMDA